MGTRTAVTGGGKLLARTPVSSANTLTTTATGGQDYIHNALIQEDRENSKGTIVALRVHSESANLQHTATPVCNTQAHRSKTQSESATNRHTGQKHRAANYASAHQRWLLSKLVSTTAYSQMSGR